MSKLLGQKEMQLNGELYISQLHLQLRKRGIHPNLLQKQKYNEFISKGKSYNLNVEKQIFRAREDAKKETLRLQKQHPSLCPTIERYDQEFRDHARSLDEEL